MAHQSTRRLEEELARLEEELEAARRLESAAEERHAKEGMGETEAVLEARRTRTEHLRKERAGFLEELRRRAVEEKGLGARRRRRGRGHRSGRGSGAIPCMREGGEASHRSPSPAAGARLPHLRPGRGDGGLGEGGALPGPRGGASGRARGRVGGGTDLPLALARARGGGGAPVGTIGRSDV